MALVRTFRLPHLEDYPVQVALFKNVTNATFLRSQLLAANPDFDYAFLDATMILSPLPLLLTTSLTLQAYLSSTLRTRTPHSELVFRLHPNNNIGESYRKFGISDTTTHLIAIKLSLPPTEVTNESVSKHLAEVVEGESVPIGDEGEELGLWADVAKIRKIYKLNDGGKGRAKGKREVAVNGGARVRDEKKEMESVIMGIMVLKGT
ncbi:CGI-121-domain-containing protein [Massarina eburnea CBS 473.64]|uniref:EKC/KEOPS complex subunit CGI121 n=1 Tax=Massarina eburnea CBS 473.64 TaxID=1395130 RepID=A0A6A6S977_9PLEO|nr:CGI-121-domain-containing protein [Massarina eburnea CBS 473.64]